MALTFTKIIEGVDGNMLRKVFDVTLDDSYPAGGEAVAAAKVGLVQIVGARYLGCNAAAAVYLWNWDVDNNKIIVGYPTGGDATAPAALADPTVVTTPDAGGTTVTGSAAKPALAGVVTPGRGKELKATTDASTLKVRMEFFGF